jgi:hypothetical protein
MVWKLVASGELRFPVLHPAPEINIRGCRSDKHMNMVRHDDVTPHQPRGRFTPNLTQELMNLVVCQPWSAILCANRIEDNCGLTFNIEHTMRRMSAIRHFERVISHRISHDESRGLVCREDETPAEPLAVT